MDNGTPVVALPVTPGTMALTPEQMLVLPVTPGTIVLMPEQMLATTLVLPMARSLPTKLVEGTSPAVGKLSKLSKLDTLYTYQH